MRECGTCNLCCITGAVEELAKPAGQLCHYSEPGACGTCTVYEARPKACAEFACMWLQGTLLGGDKPSNSGLVFIMDPDDSRLIHVQVDPARPLAWKGRHQMRRLTALSHGFVILIGLGEIEAFTYPGAGMIYTKERNSAMFNGSTLSDLGMALIPQLPALARPENTRMESADEPG